MAIGNVGGFSEGFTRGFGLVNQQQQQRADNQFRQDQLAATQDFRTQQQADQAEQNRLTAQYRGEMLSGQQAEKAAADKFRTESLGLKQEELEWMRDPTNPQYQMTVANARFKNAEAGSKNIENQLGDRYNQRLMAAQNLNLGTALALKQDLTNEERALFAELVEANDGTAFDFGDISDYVAGEVKNDVSRYVQGVAQGGDATMGPQVARSFTRALDLSDTAAMGRTIDERFENAPDHLKDGNYTVVDMGLYQPKGSVDVQPPMTPQSSFARDGSLLISGQMYVTARNAATGEEEYYFAPVTDNRVTIGGVESKFTVDEVITKSAAKINQNDVLAPIIRQRTREAKILTKFGDISKMDSGVEAFSGTVNQELDRHIRGLQGGGTPSGIMAILNKAELASLRGEQLTPSQTNMLRQRIEDNLLFDSSATAPQVGVAQWLEETRSGLKQVALPTLPRGAKYQRDLSFEADERELGRDEVRTLGDLVNIDGLPEETIAKLNGLFDSDGNLASSDRYIKLMNDLGFMIKR